jgi:hypothetical protein
MAPPIISGASPTPPGPIATTEPVYVEVYENGTPFERVLVLVRFPGAVITELAYDSVLGFAPAYAGSSLVTLAGGIGLLLIRGTQWPDGPNLRVYAFGDTGESTVDTSLAWALTDPPAPPTPGPMPVFPAGGTPNGASDAVLHDLGYFLALYDRLLPRDYIGPLQVNADVGSGYELLAGFAALGARLSLAVNRVENGSLTLYAAGGARATGLVEFYRPTDAAGEGTVLAGTVVTTSKGDRRFTTTQDAVFGPTDLGPVAVPVLSIAEGWEYNVPGQGISKGGEVLPGDIDTVLIARQSTPTESPAFWDASVKVRNIVATTGGRPPMLDGLGADRGVVRQPGESDTDYRYRVRTLPDTVSPAAIRRFLTTLFARYGLTFDLVETWEKDYQTCWDYPSSNAGTPTYYGGPLPAWLAPWEEVFVYDWPDPADPGSVPISNRWLDSVEMRAAFIVGVPLLAALEDVGMAYDDTAVTPADRTTVQGSVTGRRAVSAYDVPATLDSAFGPQGGYDGFDLPRQAFYRALYLGLQAIKAAGVTAAVELRGA